NEASADPMDKVFQKKASDWRFSANVPASLRTTQLPLPATVAKRNSKPEAIFAGPLADHDAEYWETATRGFDFSVEDRLDARQYNRILWRGVMGDDVPYPEARTGLDLRKNRSHLLKAWRDHSRTKP